MASDGLCVRAMVCVFCPVANARRTTGDISDVWWAMVELADLTAEWFDYAGPGGWNDPDMLEVGNGGMSDVEYQSHFTMWSLLKVIATH